VDEDMELPLPDEELSKWGQRWMSVMKAIRFVMTEESTDRNEWEELSEATKAW
jgi:hypothetical protein